ncbi:MAG: HEPN domain-containing protein, partial [Myxococcota bacterium]
KAENDLKIGKDEMLTEAPATDAVCFHMQQCIEKYLKAYLIFNGKEIRKTHDIAELISNCSEIDESFKTLLKPDIVKLTDYAVEIRYGEDFYFPSVDEAKEAIEICEKVIEFTMNKLKEKGFEI